MFGLILLGLAVVGGLGGWVLGRLKRRWRLAIAWILTPLCLYVIVWIWITITSGQPILEALGWGVMGLGYLGIPMMAWAIPAAISFALAGFRGKAKAVS